MSTLQELFGDEKTLTAAINDAPFVPGLISSLDLFAEKGIPTTKFLVEYKYGVVQLIPSAPRGGVPATLRPADRAGIELECCHLPKRATVYADQALNVRGFGGLDLESPKDIVDRYVNQLRQDIEATLEYHRAGAIRGEVVDATGDVLLDVYGEFGVEQQVLNLDLTNAGTDIRAKIVAAERLCEDALGGSVSPSGYLMLASPSVIDAITGHPRYQQALQFARPTEVFEDGRRGILISNTKILEYRSPTSIAFIPTDEAYLMPVGIDDFFITRFAPGDYVTSVGQDGLPVYLKSQMGPFEKYVSLEAQSNPLSVPTRPRAIIKLTKTA